MGVKKNLVNCRKPRQNNAHDLNLLFNRFDKYDFSAEVENLRISLSSQNDSNWNLITTEEEVRRIFASKTHQKLLGPTNFHPVYWNYVQIS